MLAPARNDGQMTSSLEHPPPATQPGRRRRRALVWLAAGSAALVAAALAVTIVLVTATGNSTPRPATPVIPERTGADRGLDVLPFPGTPDASPTTQITFPALLPSEL